MPGADRGEQTWNLTFQWGEADRRKENVWIRKPPVSKVQTLSPVLLAWRSQGDCWEPRLAASLGTETMRKILSLIGPQFPHL